MNKYNLMECNFYYIDDENSLLGITSGLSKSGVIKVHYHEPSNDWNKEIEFFDKNNRCIDGLILDLRLEDGQNNIEYRGSALAQELRTRQKETKFKSFPIILYSANDKLNESLEETARELFDFTQEKSKLNTPESIIEFRNCLLSLSSGYNVLRDLESKSTETILKISPSSIRDARFINTFSEKSKLPTHTLVKFIISELLEKQGLLISESTLAARLGINRNLSDDWASLTEQFSTAKYSGVFSDCWARWWMPSIEEWWDSKISSDQYIRSLPAKTRVDLIKKATRLEILLPSEKSEKSSSEAFWTICKGTNIPIDTIDGLVLNNQDNLYPWQDKEYISIDEALDETNKSAWNSVAAIEKIRLEKLKSRYGNTQRIRK